MAFWQAVPRKPPTRAKQLALSVAFARPSQPKLAADVPPPAGEVPAQVPDWVPANSQPTQTALSSAMPPDMPAAPVVPATPPVPTPPVPVVPATPPVPVPPVPT